MSALQSSSISTSRCIRPATVAQSPKAGAQTPQQTQNTAPIYEYSCLYTHDLRRKHKRWSDGFLRFHTFNRRVMLYDLPGRNFLGDTHCKRKGAGDHPSSVPDSERVPGLEEGDEILCERAGIIVEIGERIGEASVDLREVLQQKKKPGDRPEAGSGKGGNVSLKETLKAAETNRRDTMTNMRAPMTAERHRSLADILKKTPKSAPLGKAALPTKSPFEIRYGDVESGRGAKRRKVDEMTPMRKPRPDALASGREPKSRAFVELSDDDDEDVRIEHPLPNSSNDTFAMLPSSPPHLSPQPTRQQTSNDVGHPANTRPPSEKAISSPSRQRLRDLDPNSHHVRRESKNDSLATSITSKQKNDAKHRASPRQSVARRDEDNRHLTSSDDTVGRATPESSNHSEGSGFRLRMAAKPKKRTLLCQEQFSKAVSRTHSAGTETAIVGLLDAAFQQNNSETGKAKRQREQLDERPQRIQNRSHLRDISDDSDSDRHGNELTARDQPRERIDLEQSLSVNEKRHDCSSDRDPMPIKPKSAQKRERISADGRDVLGDIIPEFAEQIPQPRQQTTARAGLETNQRFSDLDRRTAQGKFLRPQTSARDQHPHARSGGGVSANKDNGTSAKGSKQNKENHNSLSFTETPMQPSAQPQCFGGEAAQTNLFNMPLFPEMLADDPIASTAVPDP